MRTFSGLITALVIGAAWAPSAAVADNRPTLTVAPWDNPCPYVVLSDSDAAPLNTDDPRLAVDACRREV